MVLGLSAEVRVGVFLVCLVYIRDSVLVLLKVMEVVEVVGMVGVPVRIQTRTLFLLLLFFLFSFRFQLFKNQKANDARKQKQL